MSEKLFRFLLSELKTVRVICRHPGCGKITELPVEQLDQAYYSGLCPFCRGVLQLPGDNALVALAVAMKKLTATAGQVDVEFVLPDKG